MKWVWIFLVFLYCLVSRRLAVKRCSVSRACFNHHLSLFRSPRWGGRGHSAPILMVGFSWYFSHSDVSAILTLFLAHYDKFLYYFWHNDIIFRNVKINKQEVSKWMGLVTVSLVSLSTSLLPSVSWSSFLPLSPAGSMSELV